MTKRTSFVVLVAVVATWFTASHVPPATSFAAQDDVVSQKWEYHGIGADNRAGPNGPRQELNKLGEDGWEVCGVMASTGEYPAVILLKRQK